MKIKLFGFYLQFGRVHQRPAAKHTSMPKPDHEASEDFWDSFSCGGTLVATCACGRTHFCSNTTLDWEDGELEELLQKSKSKPDMFIEDVHNDSVGIMNPDGRQLVWGCPCHAAARIEQFLIYNRQDIQEYFLRVAREERSRALATEEAFETEREVGREHPTR